MVDTEKHYDTDWAKAKSRDLVGKIVDDVFFTPSSKASKRADKVTVLHLGGINLTEAKQIYLPRGILPQNIVSIEREGNIAEAQKRLNIGINIVHSTLEEYVGQQKELNFDVVSLDYIGPVTSKNIALLKEIVSKQRKRAFILHTANLLSRDKSSNLYYHVSYASNSENSLTEREEEIAAELDYLPGRLAQVAARHIASFEKIEDGEPLGEIKAQSYKNIVKLGYNSFFEKKEDIEKLFNFACGEDKELILEKLARGAESFFGFSGLNSNNLIKFANGSSVTMKFLIDAIKDVIKQKLSNSGFSNDLENELLALEIPYLFSDRRVYNTIFDQSYSYISESGAPMAGNVALLRRPVKILDRLTEVGRTINFPKGFEIKDKERFSRAFNEFYGAYVKEITEKAANKGFNSEHKFLGNSSKPVLTKKRFIQELEAGKSPEDIKMVYRGWTNMPLPQWQAHYKMGTYQSRNILEQSAEDASLERITKYQALDFLASGIPANEICEAFPTSFSVGTLRALKAGITKGTYDLEGVGK